MSAGAWTPLGFVLLMLGFGLRLDTEWQLLAWLFLLGGAACMAVGLLSRPAGDHARGAFVPPGSKR